MKINIVNKNLLDSNAEVICHQVNCMGVMGSGVALGIKNKWPEVFTEYKNSVDVLEGACLGGCQLIPIESGSRAVANLFGQYYYNGYFSNPEQYLQQDFWKQPEMSSLCIPTRFTNYEAFWKSLCRLREHLDYEEQIHHFKIAKIAFPYNIGCGRGGACWEVILAMIEEAFKDKDFEVEICKI